jgi:UDP-N-acetylmuramoyl-L-alanyl-D-glutamate--2,6-diaminopimelate ligase
LDLSKFKQYYNNVYFSNIPNIEILGVSSDSRKVKKGDIFFAISGSNDDGSKYINQAIENGAVIIFTNNELGNIAYDIPVIFEQDIRKTLSLFSRILYPSQPKNIMAVTGTNGKSSIVHYVRVILELLSYKAATIGTLGIITSDDVVDTGLTTPDTITVYKSCDLLADKVDYLAIEASSHGLDQHRLDNLDLAAACFTNLTQDHLDYHKDMEAYFNAKLKLFTDILAKDKPVIINIDDDYGKRLEQICASRKVITYGFMAKDLQILSITESNFALSSQIKFNNHIYDIQLPFLGKFHIYNLVAAIGLIISVTDISIIKIMNIIPKITAVSGRMELVNFGDDDNPKVFVDYAVTPDAIEKILLDLRPHCLGELWIVFGCGGNRDKIKRPIMGKIASDNADKVIITDDNPRMEDASLIRQDVLLGAKNAIEISPRKQAINYAISNANKNDIIVIAGKGHEKYQLIGNNILPFDDVAIAQEALLERSKNG